MSARWSVNGVRCVLAAAVFAASTHVACAEVVVVVSSKNPVTTMSVEDLTDIFLGRSDRFPNGTPAVPIDQEESSPERSEFFRTYIGQSPVQVKMHWSKLIFTGRGQPPRQVKGPTEVKQLLAENPNAIGYMDRELVDDSVAVLSLTDS